MQCQILQSISDCRDSGGGGCVIKLMTVGWEYRRDGRCPIARDFLESVILAYLEWVLFVGIISEG